MSRANWFELSEEGWRLQNRARPLGALLREALQNAFDHRAPSVRLSLADRTLVIEDDAPDGLAREEYAFTVFLGERHSPPTWRGRKGRGLKELIACADEAVVETVGKTIAFDASGRRTEANHRHRGTLIRLQRRTSPREREEATKLLRLTIPPPGTRLFVDGREVRPPRLFRSLEACRLRTVEIRGGLEREIERPVRVDLYHPRSGEESRLFEMGLVVEPIRLPWHADVQQRIPLAAERDAARDPYKAELAAIAFESLATELDRSALSGAWVAEVLARFTVGEAALRAYAAKVLPRRAVISAGPRADDRARQLGARVMDLRAMPYAAVEQLKTVVETADAFIARLEGPPKDVPVVPGARAERFVALAKWLGRELLARDIEVRFFERQTRDPSAMVDAEFDRAAGVLRVNVKGRARIESPLDPGNLALLLHELAHDGSPHHDFAFIRRLESLAGRALRRAIDRPEAFAPFQRSS